MTMYVSVQTVCGCHGFLVFESIHCDRCRSLIPYQLTDESLTAPVTQNRTNNGNNAYVTFTDKKGANASSEHHKKQMKFATGHVRFRTFCPFCNWSMYVLRYYCKRERIYHHLRVQNVGDNDQSVYRSIAETQQMLESRRVSARVSQANTSTAESVEDTYSRSGSISQGAPSTILYDQSGMPTTRDLQIEAERNLYALNNLEGDLFNVLRNGLYHDTLILCQDGVKIQAHRCILGGRSNWFRNLLNEYHDVNSNDDYILQISIDDIQSDVMNEILNFMYTNRCLISLKNAPELLVAAKRFELERLRKQIADFLLSRLTVDNAIEMLICAHEAGSESLKAACIRLINRHAEKIKRTEKWRTFKTEYVDLVPELYEHRVERPAPPPAQAFLPDVFTTNTAPPENLLALTQMYENPVKKRVASPTPRLLPPPPKPEAHIPSTVQQVHHHHEPPKGSKSVPLRGGMNPVQSPAVGGRGNSPKKKPSTNANTNNNNNNNNNTKRRTGPIVAPPGPPPLVRNIFPTVRESSDVDAYRRPVNVHDKAPLLPANSQPSRTTHHPITQKTGGGGAGGGITGAEKLNRTISPHHLIEVERSPTLTSLPREDRMMLARVVSVDTME